ncbi:hypothetical protein [Winogradskya humida]|uniref:Protein kinase domain-containing protein n=1 Tax=Winogradskya humida TaxID=113566 RepID=A0ABQ3ZZ21_9ACTN|nr:hypothetical protein [Actinoplanes humidus]GIE23849.1 hypothetical protein Ahu01nite_069510 [Actinoplanes humidus]
MPADRIARETLGTLATTLGSGGQGTVYLVPGAPPWAYKEYAALHLAELNEQALTGMVRFLAAVPPRDAALVGERAAWPTAVVVRDGRVVGFTMPCVPPRFQVRMRFPSGHRMKLAQVQLLLNDDAFLAARELAVDDRLRLEILRDIAETLETFHRLGVVVGDLSPNNLFFSLAGRPRCFFIDCDAMRLRGATVLAQADTPDWETLPGEPQATPASDVYKFGLLCARLFAGDQSTTDTTAVRRAGIAVHALTVRSLAGGPASRPPMRDWCRALEALRVPAQPVVPAGPGPAARAARSAGRWTGRRVRGMRPGKIIRYALLLTLLAFCAPQVSSCAGFVRAALDTMRSNTTEQTAAEQANGFTQLLAGSGRDRERVIAAVTDVKECRKLSAAASDLRGAATARGAALERAGALQAGLLPGGVELKSELLSALSHSQAADDAYARWAAEADDRGCGSAVMKGADRAEGDAESKKATAAKKRVAELWNPIARQYGYPNRTYLQI